MSCTKLKDSLVSESVSKSAGAIQQTLSSRVTGTGRPCGSCGFQIGFLLFGDIKEKLLAHFCASEATYVQYVE